MERIPIPIEKLSVRAYGLWDKQWFLLSSGDFAAGDFELHDGVLGKPGSDVE